MIVFDIETIPNWATLCTVEWEKYKERKKITDDRDASLHPAFSLVCCICAKSRETGDTFEMAIENDSRLAEKGMLLEFRNWLHKSRDPWLAGFNVKGFDIPFLANRFLSQKEIVPSQLSVAGKKPWDIKVVDVMELLQFGSGPKLSLMDACLLVGLPSPKKDFSGSMVWDLYREGIPTTTKLSTLLAYCRGDVNQTEQILDILEATEASV